MENLQPTNNAARDLPAEAVLMARIREQGEELKTLQAKVAAHLQAGFQRPFSAVPQAEIKD
ncbi:hypothetical protein [Noviherbaspirillum sp. Root189]|uniref:hypothetical protein n=1 Tax=Noviherbaspirillum sp. Root189 TaxID=1736487 RepID=UPI00070CB919|nr:hypothetical protein [Noviherbaspirillum sp. Root189]KRB73450.1 hypothetical protein ASE07_06250 [Noviherbaspirillum sp. Root189]